MLERRHIERTLEEGQGPTPPGWMARVVGAIGALIIQVLIRLFGRVVDRREVPWLDGPFGTDQVGDRPYAELAQREGLVLARDVRDAGVLPSIGALDGPDFDSSRVDARVRDFYEHTSRYEMDARIRTFFPLSVGVWLLVKTISRQVDQLNFPVEAIGDVGSVKSEIVLLRDREGATRYTGWSRRATESRRTIYTGFYAAACIPGCSSPVVKAVFPMPNGNATVFLRPALNDRGQLELVSRGRCFGEAGFYRVDGIDGHTVRIWRVRSLVERMRLYVDEQGELRCDHDLSFWGLPVLALRYRLKRCPDDPPIRRPPRARGTVES